MERRTLILILLLSALAVGSFWLLGRDDGPAPESVGVLGNADYTLSGFTLTTVDERGDLRYRLNSARLVHYEGEETAQFEQPDVTVFRGGVPLWRIVSDQGELVGNGEEVYLLGAVTITRILEEPLQPPVTINTRDLYLVPDEERAQTGAHVEIMQPGGMLTGTGMRANLVAEDFELLADVKGTYATPKR